MEWTSELQELASRNRFIDDLATTGYDIGFINSHLVVFGVPYIDPKGALNYFDLISTLDLREGNLIDRPSDHKVWVNGEVPHNVDGRPVSVNSGLESHVVSDQLVGSRFLSNKPTRGYYLSIEEKIRQYLDLIVPPAQHKYPEATPLRALEEKKQSIPSPLKFPDALSARDGVVELSHRLLGVKVGVVGCGGTGSYILDFLAKTHAEEIHLFDDDIVHVHTLFRFPGVYTEKHLGMKKVDSLAKVYEQFHGGIVTHPVRVGDDNVRTLASLSFVIIAVDDGPSRQMICSACHDFEVPFVDVGMGLTKGSNGLFGFIRTSGGDVGNFTKLNATRFLPHENTHDNEYRRQPQIAELNALNAALAIIRFKQHFGVFDRLSTATALIFDVADISIDRFQS